MKYIIDIGHPKDIYTFKKIYFELLSEGHKILMTCNNRQYNKDLLSYYI